jgi:hypothetical protein
VAKNSSIGYLLGRCYSGEVHTWKYALKSISSICDPAKIFFMSKYSLVDYCFATPPVKLTLGQQIGGGLLIANHLDQSL